MDIKRAGSQPSGKGPAEWFTGTVRIDPLFSPPDPARVAGALVTFEPGARTAWHTHPLGQTLIVTAGCGRVQREGGPVEEIRPGDVVWFPPGEKHWHGAAPTTAMTHIAIQEKLDGKAVEWLEQVTRRAISDNRGPALQPALNRLVRMAGRLYSLPAMQDPLGRGSPPWPTRPAAPSSPGWRSGEATVVRVAEALRASASPRSRSISRCSRAPG